MSKDDEALRILMVEYQAGSLDAFQEIYGILASPLQRYLRYLAREADTAEDLLQEVFLRVVRDAQDAGAAGWKGQAKFSTWLYTIARNLCVDRSRREGIRRGTWLGSR